MNTQDILSQNWTKTRKIQELILIGLTRTQIAQLVTNGNYGFVQNVYAKMKAEGKLNQAAIENFNPSPFNKKFGIEIEAYNVEMHVLAHALQNAGIRCFVDGYNHHTKSYWKIISDSSISGVNAFELVSPVLEGEAGLEEVNKVCEVLKTLNAYINKSCGFHVHFDAQNFDLRQWKNIYKNYAGFENQIDELMPQSRRGNTNYYCRSLNSIRNLNAKIDLVSSLNQMPEVFNNSRYFKINPTSYSRHKTIEFRQHSGTIEYSKISNWLVFLHNLVDYSKNHLATDHSWDTLKSINQAEVITFYHNRKQELAA